MRYIVIPGVLLIVVLAAKPDFTLRPSNIGQIFAFPAKKIPLLDLEVARRAAGATKTSGRLLAPDEIAGVVMNNGCVHTEASTKKLGAKFSAISSAARDR